MTDTGPNGVLRGMVTGAKVGVSRGCVVGPGREISCPEERTGCPGRPIGWTERSK